MKWEDEKEKLDILINIEHLAYEKIGAIYGCTGNNIKKVAKRLNIALPVRRKISPKEMFNKLQKEETLCKNCGKLFYRKIGSSGTFCSKNCQKEYYHKIKYEKIIDGDKSIMRPNYNMSYFKNDILLEQEQKCAICGCGTEHNGKPLVFILDHIDGHASNNKRENLRMICPNCDSQLSTYKSKNKDSDRKNRYK